MKVYYKTRVDPTAYQKVERSVMRAPTKVRCFCGYEADKPEEHVSIGVIGFRTTGTVHNPPVLHWQLLPTEQMVEFCCEEMRKWWNDSAVELMEESEPAAVGIITDATAWDGELNKSRTPIRFCPWCGAGPIELVEKERVRVEHIKTTVTRPVEEWSIKEVKEL